MDFSFRAPEIIDIPSSPKMVSFGFFSREEISNTKMLEVFCPIFFYSNGVPMEGGLCDPGMGIISRFGFCNICKNGFTWCSGHLGVIRTIVPVVNPFFINLLKSLKGSKCGYCNFFKVPFLEKNYFLLKLVKSFKKSPFLNNKSENNPDFFSMMEKYNTFLKNRVSLGIFLLFIQLKKKKNFLRKFIILFSTKLNQKNLNSLWSNNLKEFLESCWKSKNCPQCGKLNLNSQKNGTSFSFETGKVRIIDRNLGFIKYLEKNIVSNTIMLVDFHLCTFRIHCPKADNFELFQISEEIIKLCRNEGEISKILMGENIDNSISHLPKSSTKFFIDSICVIPTRYRPVYWGGLVSGRFPSVSSSLNLFYSNIIKFNQQILSGIGTNSKRMDYSYINPMVNLIQKNLQSLFSHGNPNKSGSDEQSSGIQQNIEKKNGLLRMHMMGKRVVNTARSIIIPDPFLKSHEIGFPVNFSKDLKLKTPENYLRQKSNSKRYKGYCNFNYKYFSGNVETIYGKNLVDGKIQLDSKSFFYLRLISNKNKIKGGNPDGIFGLNFLENDLKEGELIIANRQPSLHRLSLMTHKAKLFPKTKCIKLHYINCSSYNADFDGDEMNIHVINSYSSLGERSFLSFSDCNLRSPTNSFPIRGLIQDHIVALIKLTGKNYFLNNSLFLNYSNLLFPFQENFKFIPAPAIIKPIFLWTGKQFFSNLLISKSQTFNFESRTKLTRLIIGEDETKVVIRKGTLLRGTLDGSQFGKNRFGLINAFNEINGPSHTSQLLDDLSRMLTIFLRMHGHTSEINDCFPILKLEKLKVRTIFLEYKIEKILIRKFLGQNGIFVPRISKFNAVFKLYHLILGYLGAEKKLFNLFVTLVKGHNITLFNKTLDKFIPGGFRAPVDKNNLLRMSLSGAKGNILNLFQIGLYIGQTELEGGSVPRGITAKSLACFKTFDFSPISIGFIKSSFSNGLPQSSYYFHCMAGREGILDTSIKTSYSGYLQRSLIKHLESAKLEYDLTLRYNNNRLIQLVSFHQGFQSTGSKKLSGLNWKLHNFEPNISQFSPYNKDITPTHPCSTPYTKFPILKLETIKKKLLSRSQFPNFEDLASICFQYFCNLEGRGFPFGTFFAQTINQTSRKFFRDLEPGEPFGLILGQSLGEPCTQMTLNTFHNAGKLTSHRNLGVPRLKELLLSLNKLPRFQTFSVHFKQIPMKIEKILENRLNNWDIFSSIFGISTYLIRHQKILKLHISIRLPERMKYKHLLNKNYRNIFRKIRQHLAKIENCSQIFKNWSIEKPKYLKKDSFQIFLDELMVDPINLKKTLQTEVIFQTKESKKNNVPKKNDKTQSSLIFHEKRTIPFGLRRGSTGKTSIPLFFFDSEKKVAHFQGANARFFWDNLDIFENHNFFSNDVASMFSTFGVEAARLTLLNELQMVFDFHAINIRQEFMDFLADYLTGKGTISAFSRTLIEGDDSFQSISYERAITFISNYAITNNVDNFKSVSSNIVFSKICTLGTGNFDIFLL